MCGICGIYGQGDKAEVIKMMPMLQHRGQDSEGVYIDENVGLGHCRLSIIDLTPLGNQPMANEDGTVFLVINGEIYNYKEIRENLSKKGHVFRSRSDSETVIHAYEEYGERFVNVLRGMFALAVYDTREKKLILARDPIGKKPLYYSTTKGKLAFASEIKALFEVGILKEVNLDAIPSYLMYQYVAGMDTMFKNVFRLPAGSILVVCPDRITLEKYWELSEGIWNGTTNHISVLRDLLEESVQLRLQSDVPVGAFLSGGVDSSSVIALYRKFSNKEIHTFTATFETNSEAYYAKKVSAMLDTRYHEVPITADMVAQDIKKITWHHDEPLGDAATINNYYLSREAKRFVTVVLAGEGGDELFGGYPWHGFVPAISVMSRVPVFIRRALQPTVDDIFGNGDATSKLNRWHRILSFPLQRSLMEMQMYPTTAMSQQNIRWLTGFKERKNGLLPTAMKNPLNQMLSLDCLNTLQKFLMKADKATMSHAIEERLPLLDKKIIEYAFSLSPSLKKDKYVLRKAVEDLLPDDIVWRKKQGFGTPLADWLNSTKLKEMAMDRLRDGELLREVCNRKALDKLVGKLNAGEIESGVNALSLSNVIWSVLALQVWYDVFF